MSVAKSSDVVINMVADSFTYASVPSADPNGTVLFVRLGPGSEQIDAMGVRRPIDPIPFPDAPREFSVLAPNNHSDPGRMIAGSLPVHPHASIPAIPTHHFASSFYRQHGAESAPISAIAIPPGIYNPSPVVTGPFVAALQPDSLGRAAMRLRIVSEADANLLTLDDTTGLTVKYDSVPLVGGATLAANDGYPWIVESISPLSIGLISNSPSDTSHSTRRCSLVRGVTSVLYRGDVEGVGITENGGFDMGWVGGRTYSFVRDSGVTNPPQSATNNLVNANSGNVFSPRGDSIMKDAAINGFLGLDRLSSDSSVWIYGKENMDVPSGSAVYRITLDTLFVNGSATSTEFSHPTPILTNAIEAHFQNVPPIGDLIDVQIDWATISHASLFLTALSPVAGDVYEFAPPIVTAQNRCRLLIARTNLITAASGGAAVSLDDLNAARIGCIEIECPNNGNISTTKVTLSISVRGWWGGTGNATFMAPTPLVSTPPAPAPFVESSHSSGKSSRNLVISLPQGANGGPRTADEATNPGAVTDIVANLSEASSASMVTYTYRTGGMFVPFGSSRGRVFFWRPNHHTEAPAISTILVPSGFSLEVSDVLVSGASATFQTFGRGMLPSYESPFSQGSDAHLVEVHDLLVLFNNPGSAIALRLWSDTSVVGGFESWSQEAVRIARFIETLARANPSSYPPAVPPGPNYALVGAEAAKNLWIGLRSVLISGAPHANYATGLERKWVAHSWDTSQIGTEFTDIVKEDFGVLRYDRNTSLDDIHHRSPFGGFVPRGGVEATRWAVVLDPTGATNVPAKFDGTSPADYTYLSGTGERVARVVQLSLLDPDPAGPTDEDVRITTDYDLAYYGHNHETYGRMLYVAAVCYEYGGTSVYSYDGSTSETVADGIREFLLSNIPPVEALGQQASSGEPFPLLQLLLNVSSVFSTVTPDKPGDGTKRYFSPARGHDWWKAVTYTSPIGMGEDRYASSFGDVTLCYFAAARLINAVVNNTPSTQLHTLRSVGLLSAGGTGSVLVALGSSAATSSHITAYDESLIGASVTLAHQRSSQHGIHAHASAHSPLGSINFAQSAYFDNGVLARRGCRGFSTSPSRLPSQYPLRGFPVSIVVGISECLGGIAHPPIWHLSGPLSRLLNDIIVHAPLITDNVADSSNNYVAQYASVFSNADGQRLTEESKAIYRRATVSLRHRITFPAGLGVAYPLPIELDLNPTTYRGSSGPADVVAMFTLLGQNVTLGTSTSDI